MEGLAKLEQGIADMIAAAHAADECAKRLLASCRAAAGRGASTRSRRDAGRGTAGTRRSTRQTIIAEAREAAEEERGRARHEITFAKDDALVQIADKAGQLAVDVAGKIPPPEAFGRRPDPARPAIRWRASPSGKPGRCN